MPDVITYLAHSRVTEQRASEQMALLMNNAFRLANAPAFPALSLTPIAIYRTTR